MALLRYSRVIAASCWREVLAALMSGGLSIPRSASSLAFRASRCVWCSRWRIASTVTSSEHSREQLASIGIHTPAPKDGRQGNELALSLARHAPGTRDQNTRFFPARESILFSLFGANLFEQLWVPFLVPCLSFMHLHVPLALILCLIFLFCFRTLLILSQFYTKRQKRRFDSFPSLARFCSSFEWS